MDITQVIRDDHNEQRRLFAAIQDIDASDTDALKAVWGRLRALLDSHAEAEERFFYPDLLKLGTAARTPTTRKRKPRTRSRITTTSATPAKRCKSTKWGRPTGSPRWPSATSPTASTCPRKNAKACPTFASTRRWICASKLAVRFLAFQCAHLTGVQPVDRDADDYIAHPKETMGKAQS